MPLLTLRRECRQWGPMQHKPGLSLRTILSGVTIGGTLLALAAIVILAVVAASLHRSTSRLGDATECILLGDEARLALRRYARVQDPSLKREVDREIRRDIAAAYRYVDTPEEKSSWEEARARSNQYLDDSSDDSPQHRDRLGTALDAIEDFVSATATRARHDRVDASRWDTFASTIALSASTCLLFASIALLWWLRFRAFEPIFELAAAMDRFARGDRAARAREHGPAELRDMAVRFNDMASALAAQRNAQVAFLGGVAHDLRGPLTVLQTYATSIRPGDPAPSAAQMRSTFERVNRQVARLDRMIGDLVDTARLEAGQFDLRLERQDLRALAREAFEAFQADHRHILEIDMPEQAVHARCDPMRVNQVLTNLLTNAGKYSRAGTKIRLSLGQLDGYAVVSVEDEGRGIPSADQVSIFQPFERGGLSKEGIPGVGLGLYVVQRIVEAHDGQIEVRSEPGKGSIFEIRLPLWDEGDVAIGHMSSCL